MKLLILFLVWCILLAVSWPIALGALLLLPLVYIVSLPFRLAAVLVSAMLAFVRALLFLPARLLGHRRGA